MTSIEGDVDVSGFLPRSTALVLAGGVNHEYDQACASIVELLDEAGIDAKVVYEPDGLASLDHDLLMVDALWWRMTLDRYDAVRDKWAREISADARSRVEAHIDAGRSVLALHTASICFDDWSRWGEIVGGSWNWERSSHPQLGDEPVHISVNTGTHPIVEAIGEFEVVDEVYGFLDLQPDVEALASSAHGGIDHPVLWARTLPSGSRVVYDALGHDRRSVEHPVHREIIRRSIAWVMASALGDGDA